MKKLFPLPLVLFAVLSLSALTTPSVLAQNSVFTGTTNITTVISNNNIWIGPTNGSTPAGNVTVSTGGELLSSQAITNGIIIGATTTASNNSLIIDGGLLSGSSLRFSNGINNTVVATNGGQIILGLIGEFNGLTALQLSVGTNNSLLVTGAGTVMTVNNGNALSVGTGVGVSNSFTLADGARFNMLSTTTPFVLGTISTGHSSRLTFTGEGTIMTNTAGNQGGLRINGGSNNVITVSDGAKVYAGGNGPGLLPAGVVIGANLLAPASDNKIIVEGEGSLLQSRNTVHVGWASSGDLIVRDGGQFEVLGGSINLGNSNTATSNNVLVTLGGSITAGSSVISVGAFSVGNTLSVDQQGTVDAQQVNVGVRAEANGNRLTVDGAGSALNSSVALQIGAGSDNQIVITNGASAVIANTNSLAATVFDVGTGAAASNNEVLVTGAGSSLDHQGRTNSNGRAAVGSLGSGNSLVVSNGATASFGGTNGTTSQSFFVGRLTNANNNSVTVTGAGSLFTARGDLIVGTTNAGNIFNVNNAAVAHAAGLRIGTNNTVTTDAAVWIGKDRPSTQSLNILHSQEESTSVANVNGRLEAATTVTVASQGVLSGIGTVQALTTIIAADGTISPGNSPGTLNIAGDIDWLGGGNYNWQVLGTTNTGGFAAGVTWDLINVTGVGELDLTALNAGNQFKINLWSLGSAGPDVDGSIADFDPSQIYTWTIARALGGITNYTGTSQFLINTGATNGTGGFANDLAGGSFSVLQSGNDLNLVFTPASAPIPEPGTWAAAALLAAGAAFARWRRRKTA